MSDRALARVGAACALVGAVLALVFNLLHPRPSSFEDPVRDQLRMVAESDAWIPIHLGIVLSVLLIVLGLFALARSLKGGPAEGLARLALGGLLISTPVALVTLAVDGYALKAVADAVGGQATGSAEGSAIVHIVWALFTMFIITFLGVTPFLFGLAVASDPGYSSPLGYGAILLGSAAVVNGASGILGGPSAGFFVVFTVVSGLLTLWVLALGVVLLRAARQRVGAA
jgi:hypothetical protein